MKNKIHSGKTFLLIVVLLGFSYLGGTATFIVNQRLEAWNSREATLRQDIANLSAQVLELETKLHEKDIALAEAAMLQQSAVEWILRLQEQKKGIASMHGHPATEDLLDESSRSATPPAWQLPISDPSSTVSQPSSVPVPEPNDHTLGDHHSDVNSDKSARWFHREDWSF
jgi:hypothetical protein